ncbi:MAG TPA: hypothetical protein DC054_01165 [Blastocatellia bacterium]|nr:hypothetical protein [Blastocatellia bacterium]
MLTAQVIRRVLLLRLPGILPVVLVCAGLCAAQQTPEPQDAPSGLVVLKVKRERHREEHDVKITATDPNLSQSTGIMPSGATPTVYVYEYWLDIRNDSPKKVTWFSWVYVLTDQDSRQELDRQEFVTFEKTSAAQKKTVVGRRRFSPTGSAGTDPLKKKNGPPLDERVEFNCVVYEDGTLWHSSLISETHCREAGKSGKSH